MAFTYRGYSTVGKRHPNTQLHDIQLVEQDLMNHFQTRVGERVGRPGFGSIIWDLMFNLSDDRTESLIDQDINRIVGSDPRVTLLEIKKQINNEKHSIEIKLKLKMREINVSDWFTITFQ